MARIGTSAAGMGTPETEAGTPLTSGRSRDTNDQSRDTSDRSRDTSDRSRDTSDRCRNTNDRNRDTSDRSRDTSDWSRDTSDQQPERGGQRPSAECDGNQWSDHVEAPCAGLLRRTLIHVAEAYCLHRGTDLVTGKQDEVIRLLHSIMLEVMFLLLNVHFFFLSGSDMYNEIWGLEDSTEGMQIMEKNKKNFIFLPFDYERFLLIQYWTLV
eukprot:g41832.t1